MLKALELAGFKSFADKTRLEFPRGVTCVVGPNGSGKSNVVDAIKWVLGSQSAKSLRGSEMTDVIFNGAAGRRPLNAAEVCLEFDNTAGLIELSEPTVRITRRVYRSGEGEYAINGAACRLKDIRALLAGTGIGVGAYNIIEQGRVDAVLNASPRDRRALFEEAAGISRFRIKKQDATRRLARVEQNLLRLSDIVDEVEGRLRRVRMQAGKARKYREQSTRFKELRTQLGLSDWGVFSARLDQLASTQASLSAELQQQAEAAEEAESRLEATEQGASAAEQLSAASQELATLRERLASLRSSVASDSLRAAELRDALTHARRRLVATRLDAAAQSGAVTLVELQAKLEEQRAKLSEAKALAERAEEQASARGVQLEELGAEKERLTQRAAAIEKALAEAHREEDRLAVRLELARQRLAEQRPQSERTESQHAETVRQVEACAERLADHRQRLAEAEQHAAETKQCVEELQQELAEQRQQVARLEAAHEADRRQLQSLKAADLQLDQLRKEMSRLLGAGVDARVCGLVADILHVDFDTAPIIEAALGERAHHLVIDNGAALLEVLTGQGDPLAARANFQRLDAKLPGAAVDRIDLSREPGVMGRADRFVDAEPEFAEFVSRLLGRTWIVDQLATAVRLSTGAGAGLSFVTFQGEVITADGVIVAGPQSESAGVLTRRRQIAMLSESLESHSDESATSAESLRATERRLAEAAANADKAEAERATLAAQMSELGQRSAALAERTERLTDQLRQAGADEEKLAGQIEEVRSAIQAGRVQRSRWETDLAACVEKRKHLAEQIQAVQGEQSAAESSAAEARLAMAGIEQHAEILAGQVAQIQRDASQRTSAEAAAVVELERCGKRLEACELQLLSAGAEIAELAIAAERVAWRRRGLAESQREETERRQQLARRLSQARRQAESTRARLGQSELESERTRLELSSLVERMLEDYGIDLAQAAAETPSAAVPVPPEERESLEREVARLRGQVGDVGTVNLESLDELDELEERFEELSAQYKDLSEAKSSLERLAARISTESRQLFLSTVDEVRGHFRELYRRLFGGGEADIVIEEAEGGDPLEAGVEIEASPPGKELRSISLLSGGEKTMTCVALLLAVFRAKPSPFCVLDEVDAALDEANIGRFTGVLSEFLSATQFLVVTHSKKTMTGADTLYGVTMQESGVSKQVSVRFEDVGEDGQIHAAATLRRAA